MKSEHRTASLMRGAMSVVCCLGSAVAVAADTHYVDIACTNPVPPFTNWAMAATVIQAAVDQAGLNDTVLVSAGVYDTGGRVAAGDLTNRVAILRPVVVRSVGGPAITSIRGQGPNGDGAVRCAYVTNGAVLAGFTLTNGAARLEGDYLTNMSGGGAWCAPDGVVSNCVFVENTAPYAGGGASGGTLYNCTFSGNAAFFGGGAFRGTMNNCALYANSAGCGGGAYEGTLNNCTLSGNSAIIYGGGIEYGTMTNCLIYYNTAPAGANWGGGALRYCCTTPNPGSEGCIADEPALASASHLSLVSPCRGRGRRAIAAGCDVDGEPWLDPPAMGCDEVHEGAATGSLRLAIEAPYTNVAVGFPAPLTARIEGAANRSAWSFGDGATLSNRPYASHAWSGTGVFTVVLTAWNDSHPTGVMVTASLQVQPQQVRYVAMSNAAAAAPYDAWSNAATRIQDAVEASVQVGGLVLVSNGIYDTGGRVAYGAVTSRVAIVTPLVVRSVHGPDATAIRGQGPDGPGAVRCAYVTDGALLAGFTLTNGTAWYGGDPLRDVPGGGVWCEAGGVVSNCTLAGNSAYEGGGAFQGTLNDCTLSANTAYEGGGTFQATLNNCTLAGNAAVFGGGAAWGAMDYCRFVGNYAETAGGGVSIGTLNNCLLTGNSSQGVGGGAAWGTLNNCTLAGNSADGGGGGASESQLINCIVYDNSAGAGATNNWDGGPTWLEYCCTTPGAPGTNNIAGPPRFVDAPSGDYRLLAVSPCIDAGINADGLANARDVDGNPRIFNGRVDIGACEFTMTTHAKVWLQGAHGNSASAMANALHAAGMLPTQSPYAGDKTESQGLPSNTADWVLLELRRTNDLATVASQCALLRSDGVVANEDGEPGLRLEASPGPYYLAAKHRNHLAVMSALPLQCTHATIAYAVTAEPDRCLGGTNACVELEPGLWGLRAGDADGDGRITAADREVVERQIGKTGYLPGDLNLDGVVDGND